NRNQEREASRVSGAPATALELCLRHRQWRHDQAAQQRIPSAENESLTDRAIARACYAVPLTRTGHRFVECVLPPVNGAYIYNWRVALASAPTTYVKQQQTTAASNTFDSLTPGQLYNVELNAVGTAGTTDGAAPVS